MIATDGERESVPGNCPGTIPRTIINVESKPAKHS